MNYLNRRYPFVKHSLRSLGIISFSLFVIVLILQPFGFDQYEGNKILMASGFGIITFLSLDLQLYH